MEKIYEVKNRVKNLVEERGFSYNYLSLKFGKNPTYLQKFVEEKSPSRIKSITNAIKNQEATARRITWSKENKGKSLVFHFIIL